MRNAVYQYVACTLQAIRHGAQEIRRAGLEPVIINSSMRTGRVAKCDAFDVKRAECASRLQCSRLSLWINSMDLKAGYNGQILVTSPSLTKASVCTSGKLRPCGHYTLDQRRNLVKNNVTTLFQLHFNVVPTSDARWGGPAKEGCGHVVPATFQASE